jgi:hypothetical protein
MNSTPLSFALFAGLSLLLATAEVRASVLTFDLSGLSNGQSIDQTYGDNITAPTIGGFSYGSAQGFTPNISVAYGPNDARLWADSFGDVTNVLISAGDNTLLTLTFTAAAGLGVRLHSFDLVGWTPGFASDPTINSITVFDGNDNLLFSQTGPSISISSHTTFAFGAPLVAEELRVQIDALNIDSDDIGIDNVIFSETVPEPGFVLSLANGVAALAGLTLRHRTQRFR